MVLQQLLLLFSVKVVQSAQLDFTALLDQALQHHVPQENMEQLLWEHHQHTVLLARLVFIVNTTVLFRISNVTRDGTV
jgi:hypothetical protein